MGGMSGGTIMGGEIMTAPSHQMGTPVNVPMGTESMELREDSLLPQSKRNDMMPLPQGPDTPVAPIPPAVPMSLQGKFNVAGEVPPRPAPAKNAFSTQFPAQRLATPKQQLPVRR